MKSPTNRIVSIFLVLILAACNSHLPRDLGPSPTPSEVQVMATFQVKLPEPVPEGEQIYLAEVDEVTGLAFNSTLHIMEALDNQNFTVLLPLRLNTLFKYRYLRQGKYTVIEHAADGQPVRYRVFYAREPGLVQDVIHRWADTPPVQKQGRILGKALRQDNEQPIPNLIVAAGGLQTLTLADGSFVLENVAEGTHNLVAYAPDGSFEIFQQGALVQNGATTEAIIHLRPTKMVKVTFLLEIPPSTPPGATIRLAGNWQQLGNVFASLLGGVNNTAIRLPGMQRLEDGRYTFTASLPVGFDIRYKYTLGDGVWNSEQNEAGEFRIRQFMVPDHDIEVVDRVVRWNDTDQHRITFDVTVPENTPKDEIVSIQFNPGYAWMEPIPMWLVEPNRWIYTLYSPLRGLENLHYRYCRDLQCGSADDQSTTGALAPGREVAIEDQPQLVTDQVNAWAWLEGETGPAVVPNIQVVPRPSGFVAGIALQDAYHPSWFFRLPRLAQDVEQVNANWIVVQPSRTYSNTKTPFPEAISGEDLGGNDLSETLNFLSDHGLHVALFPRFHYAPSDSQWWQEAPRDFPWWVSWFTYYQKIILHYAQIGAQTGASALILGDPSLNPAFPSGKLDDGSPSHVPEDADSRWREILQAVRTSFSGQIWWALEYPSGSGSAESQLFLPTFIDSVDGVYVFWNSALSTEASDTVDDWVQHTGDQLDSILLPIQQQTGKPIYLVIRYPSAQGAVAGCLPGPENQCLEPELLNQPTSDLEHIHRDLKEQENAYNAILRAVNDRAWISGVISDGYYFPVPLQDKSMSIHGKPARGVLWFWFGHFLGKQIP